MTRLVAYELINQAEWRLLVRESETGTWFQSPEAYDFFASMPELFRPFAFGIMSKPESNSGLTDKGDNRPSLVDTIYCSDQDYEAEEVGMKNGNKKG